MIMRYTATLPQSGSRSQNGRHIARCVVAFTLNINHSELSRTRRHQEGRHPIDNLNQIEAQRQYRYAAAVMPRRTDAINSIESEGRYMPATGTKSILSYGQIATILPGTTSATRGHCPCAVSSCRLGSQSVPTAPHDTQAIGSHSVRSLYAPHIVPAMPDRTNRYTFNL